jgi:biotin carboxyl carrier protein
VAAPIPGVILSVGVKTGDEVKTGQELCILEAMKMKNTIRAARDGKIASVHVSAGDQVSHGQALMDYSE